MDQSKEAGEVQIGLYDIATGPIHQDFVITMKKVNFLKKIPSNIYRDSKTQGG